jgi:hypothetical protein
MSTRVDLYDADGRRIRNAAVAEDMATDDIAIVTSRVDPFAAVAGHLGDERRKWNYGRRTLTRTAWNVIATPFAPATYYPILLDTRAGYDFDRYDTSIDTDGARASGGAFICNSPGLYNLKAVLRGLVSAPAVVPLAISEVWFGYEYTPATPYDPAAHPAGYHELGGAFSTIGQVPGFPPTNVVSYVRGWSIPGADKIAMRCGDQLRPVWWFDAAGQIEYFDKMFCRVALARVGEIPTTEEGCC